MIDRQLDIPRKAHEIFCLGPKTPPEIWGATSKDAYEDLHKQDILVTDHAIEKNYLGMPGDSWHL